ncbi:SCO family protein [Chthoniobacter sp.]|uniref:SCO family protein n=1 Tax=Chthoniobacter sp. TaxID=2510640 RepID=UPI0032AE8B21
MRLLPIAFLGVALLFAACEKREAIEMLQPPATPAVLQKYWALPDFNLTERSGQPLRLADLAGKVWVADFFYSSCPGPCPALTSNLSDVQKALGSAPDVRLVSISVDPEKDTTEVLKAYAERFKAGPGWFFCTGERDAIYQLAHDGFKLPIAAGTPETGPVTHTTRLILVDQTGMVRGFYEGATKEGVSDLVRDIKKLLEEK